MSNGKPILFCHDGATIYYPTRPGRVHAIGINALADCNGSAEDYSDSTGLSDCFVMACHGLFIVHDDVAPMGWPMSVGMTEEDVNAEFTDLLSEWADWCDRQDEAADLADGVPAGM